MSGDGRKAAEKRQENGRRRALLRRGTGPCMARQAGDADMYENFARVYDTFMDNVPYNEWARYLIRKLKENGVEDGLVLDLGCGTGQITRRLADAGYDMIGADGSEDMLQIAQEAEFARKRDGSGALSGRRDILYLQQDIREFELYGTVRAVISTCDTLNYITEREDLLRVFRLVNNYLDPNGLFLFDMNTVSHYRDLCADNTFAESRDDCSFIWENDYDSLSGINEYDLTLFLRREDGLYERFFETHREKAWETETVRALLEEAGMRYIGVLEAYTDAPATDRSDRVLICAAEQGK